MVIEQEQEQLIQDLDIPNDQYRYEFSLRRNALIRHCDKYNLTVNMETMMGEQFQRFLLNELVLSRGLHYNLLNKKDYRRMVNQIFHWNSSIDLDLKLAESIQNKKPASKKPYQHYRLQLVLNSCFISIINLSVIMKYS